MVQAGAAASTVGGGKAWAEQGAAPTRQAWALRSRAKTPAAAPTDTSALDRSRGPEGGDGLVPAEPAARLGEEVRGRVPAPGHRQQVGGDGANLPLPIPDRDGGQGRATRSSHDRCAGQDIDAARAQGLGQRRRRLRAGHRSSRDGAADVEQAWAAL